MPATLSSEDAASKSPLPALLRASLTDQRPIPPPVETPRARRGLGLARATAVLLLAPCLYFGAKIAAGDRLPSLPGGLAAETSSVVAADGRSAVDRDIRHLHAFGRAAAAASAGTAGADPRPQAHRPKRGDEEQAPPAGADSGNGGGGTDNGTSEPKLTLPVVGPTPVPDPGLEVPDLPVDPGAIPDVGDVTEGASVTVPDVDVPLP